MTDDQGCFVSVFDDLDPHQQEMMRDLCVPQSCEIGDVLFEQGDPAEHIYIITRGEVAIRYKPEDGPALTVTRVRPEGVVGWSAALGNPAYTSGAICTADSDVLRIKGDDLRRLCEADPSTGASILERLATLIAKRLKNTHNHVVTLLEQGMGSRGAAAVAHKAAH